jgi:hypothetical protein
MYRRFSPLLLRLNKMNDIGCVGRLVLQTVFVIRCNKASLKRGVYIVFMVIIYVFRCLGVE